MRASRHKNVPEDVYPLDEWRLVEKRFDSQYLGAAESLFAISNGYLGMRGTCDEGQPRVHSGTYVNGFHETWPIVYGEEAYGFAKEGQTIIDVPDAKVIKLYVDDEPFYLPTATIDDFERVLDMRNGTLDRELVWTHSSGQRVSIKSRRLVSFEHRHLAAIAYDITLLTSDAPVVIVSELARGSSAITASTDPRIRQFGCEVLEPVVQRASKRRVVLGFQTQASKMTLSTAIDHAIETDCAYSVETKSDPSSGQVTFSIDATRGKRIRVIKYITYHSSRRPQADELCRRSELVLDRAVQHGFEDLVQSQRLFLDDFWRRSDVIVEGYPEWQQTVRFNLFQICQATARAEGCWGASQGTYGSRV